MLLLMSRRCTTRGLQNATLLGLGLRVFAVPPRRFPPVWSCRGTRVALQLAQLASSLPACRTPRRGGTRQNLLRHRAEPFTEAFIARLEYSIMPNQELQLPNLESAERGGNGSDNTFFINTDIVIYECRVHIYQILPQFHSN
jgi:hypothetical protein